MSNLTTLFTDIANAIREKKGTTDSIVAETFPVEIQNISVGGATVEGMQQFISEDEMQEQGIKEYGKLATVYGATVSNMTASTEIQHITFPKTVVLPEAVTESTYCMIMSMGTEYGEGNIELSPTYFAFFFNSTGVGIRAEYSSTDGITYTRTDTRPETLDFGMPVGCAKGYEDMWDDNFGYFAQCSIPYYGGIFNYGDYTSDEYVKAGVLSDTKPVDTIAYVKPLFDMMPDIQAHIPLNIEGAEIKTKRVKYYTVAQISDTKYELYTRAHYRSGDSMYEFFECGVKRNSTTSTWHICPHSFIASASIPVIDTTSEAIADNTAYMMFKYEVNTETKTFTCTQLRASEFTSYVENNSNKIIYQLYNQALDTSLKLFGIYYSHILSLYLFNYAIDGTGSNFQTEWAILQKYVPAQTQLTAASNTVGKDQIFYGANGLEVGTASLTEISNQDKTVTPTIETQTVTADSSYTGLGTVTVEGVTSAIDTNIIPENIKKDVSILGVTGTLQEASNEPIDIEGAAIFASVEEMNATAGNEGDLAVVYVKNFRPVTTGEANVTAIFPETVVVPTAVTSTSSIFGTIVAAGVYIALTKTAATIRTGAISGTILAKYTSTDGITYTRTTEAGEVTMASVSSVTANHLVFFAVESHKFQGIYINESSEWKNAPTVFDTTAEYVFEKEFYSSEGIKTGTLGETVDSTFKDVPAQLYAKFQSEYNKMTPVVLEDGATLSDIFIVPTKYDGTPLYDTSNMTTLYRLFSGNKNIECVPSLNTAHATSGAQMFYHCQNLKYVGEFDTSNMTDMDTMYYNCHSLEKVPTMNTSKVTNMRYMFTCDYALKEVPAMNTSNVTNMESMFNMCESLKSVPMLDTSSVTKISFIFSGCKSLTEIPLLDTSKATEMSRLVSECESITSIPALNTSSCTRFAMFAQNCTSLVNVPVLDMSKAVALNNAFLNCPVLSNQSLNNILAMCANATAYITQGTNMTLAYLGLTEEQATTCTTLSNYSAFTSAGWTTGY